jgi:hypothetical protein
MSSQQINVRAQLPMPIDAAQSAGLDTLVKNGALESDPRVNAIDGDKLNIEYTLLITYLYKTAENLQAMLDICQSQNSVVTQCPELEQNRILAFETLSAIKDCLGQL